jgi:hypothetical protein
VLLQEPVSIPGRGKDFSVRHRFQTGCVVHPESKPMRTVGSFPGI